VGPKTVTVLMRLQYMLLTYSMPTSRTKKNIMW